MSLCISLCTSRKASSSNSKDPSAPPTIAEVTNLSTPGSLLAEICIFAASFDFLLTPVFFFLLLLRHVPAFFEHVTSSFQRFPTKSCFNHFLDRCTAHVTQSFFYDLHEQAHMHSSSGCCSSHGTLQTVLSVSTSMCLHLS